MEILSNILTSAIISLLLLILISQVKGIAKNLIVVEVTKTLQELIKAMGDLLTAEQDFEAKFTGLTNTVETVVIPAFTNLATQVQTLTAELQAAQAQGADVSAVTAKFADLSTQAATEDQRLKDAVNPPAA